jgi:hypothetical protein
VGVAFTLDHVDALAAWQERITRQGDDGCTLVGYSTVRGDALRQDTPGVVDMLGQSCDICQGRTSRYSKEAQTLEWVQETICSPSFPTPPGGRVVFLGGANDDLFYRPPGALVARLLGMLRYATDVKPAQAWQEAVRMSNRQALETIDRQIANIRNAIECSKSRGSELFFFHDFLIWDLDAGRPPDRQATFEHRRDAVQYAGGSFVDLLQEFAATAGVSWFNDFVHPSAFGQRQIAENICKSIAHAASAQIDRSKGDGQENRPRADRTR